MQCFSTMPLADGGAGWPDQAWFMPFLEQATARHRAASSTFAVLYLDLSNLKNMQYAFGNLVCDLLVKVVMARLCAATGPTARVARIGNDGLAVMLEDCPKDETVDAWARRLCAFVREPIALRGDEPHAFHAVLGMSLFPNDGEHAETLLRHAELATQSARSAGNGAVSFYAPLLSSSIRHNLRIEQELRRALLRREFVLHFQPRVDCASGKLCGLEALLRWQHPQRGLIAPSEFIDIAEKSGLIVALGEQVLEAACDALSTWREHGVDAVPLSINVSRLQLEAPGFSARVAQTLAAFQVDSSLLEIEVTESCVVRGGAMVQTQLRALSALGITLLVDDFGTGYSSLSFLQQFDMHILKIDKSFVDQLGVSAQGATMVQAIIAMADALGMGVVAEGVETARQFDLLRSLGCKEAQGFYFCRPMAHGDIVPLLRARHAATAVFGRKPGELVRDSGALPDILEPSHITRRAHS
jgi:diguanylate cyclase (GGDEF)-like protein